MKIKVTRQERITLLKWLSNDEIDTADLPQLNETIEEKDLWVEALKKLTDQYEKKNNEEYFAEVKKRKEAEMKIPINRQLKIILLKWLKQGYMNTDDIPELNNVRNNLTKTEVEMEYTEDDMKDVPEELLVELAGYIQDAKYQRTQTK